MGAIRIESDGAGQMSQVYLWLTKHRGGVVPLDAGTNLTLGMPISGARAVIVAAVLDNGVGGVLRALTNLSGPPVRLVFDIRSTGGRKPQEVRTIGAQALAAISRQISESAPTSQVA